MPQIFHTTHNTLTGTSGSDSIYGNKAAETLEGLGGDDLLKGGTGNDTLLGGDGNDTLLGGVGADVLTGGAGANTFVFQYYTESKESLPSYDPGRVGVDTITDFKSGIDKLDFRNLHLTESQILIESADDTHHTITVLINELPENNMRVDVIGDAPVLADFLL